MPTQNLFGAGQCLVTYSGSLFGQFQLEDAVAQVSVGQPVPGPVVTAALGEANDIMPVFDKAIEKAPAVGDPGEFQPDQPAPPQASLQRQGSAVQFPVEQDLFSGVVPLGEIAGDIESQAGLKGTGRGELRVEIGRQPVDLHQGTLVANRQGRQQSRGRGRR
jgi:hypothetical protein